MKDIIRESKARGLELRFSIKFKKEIKYLRKSPIKNQLTKLIQKIIKNPNVGKPMRYSKKGLREVYVNSFRIYYLYSENIISFTEFSHKDRQ